jgi:hypothetical protein
MVNGRCRMHGGKARPQPTVEPQDGWRREAGPDSRSIGHDQVTQVAKVSSRSLLSVVTSDAAALPQIVANGKHPSNTAQEVIGRNVSFEGEGVEQTRFAAALAFPSTRPRR